MEGRPLDEAELIAQARLGDVGAYGELVKMHQEIAQRSAYLITGDATDAQDVAQTAFVKAFQALGRFDPTRAFRPWLLSIVANEARNARRSAGRRSGLQLRLARELPRADAAPSPEAAALHEADRGRLLQAISGLDEGAREVVTHRYLLGLSEADTATALGIARGTVKSRLSRALRRLRRELEVARD